MSKAQLVAAHAVHPYTVKQTSPHRVCALVLTTTDPKRAAAEARVRARMSGYPCLIERGTCADPLFESVDVYADGGVKGVCQVDLSKALFAPTGSPQAARGWRVS